MDELSVHELMAKDLWGEHPVYTRDDWKSAVAGGDVQAGYWDWVFHMREMDEFSNHNDSIGG